MKRLIPRLGWIIAMLLGAAVVEGSLRVYKAWPSCLSVFIHNIPWNQLSIEALTASLDTPVYPTQAFSPGEPCVFSPLNKLAYRIHVKRSDGPDIWSLYWPVDIGTKRTVNIVFRPGTAMGMIEARAYVPAAGLCITNVFDPATTSRESPAELN